MATSGSTNFSMTRDDLIKAALRLIYVAENGETPTAQQIVDGAECLNLMVKSWGPDLHQWTMTPATLFCVGEQAEYNLPGAYATSDYDATTLSSAGVATDTTLTVASITGITNGDYIGILLDSNAMHWTTVNGVPSGNSVVIADALPSAAAIGRAVYSFTTKIGRPLKITNVCTQQLSGTEIPHAYNGIPQSRSDYMRMPNKTTLGTPIQSYYSPQLTTGKLYLWPTPKDSTLRITFDYERTLEDFDDIANTPDFPQEWYNVIKWNLAVELAPDYNITPSNFLLRKAEELKNEMLSFDRDPGSLYFQPRLY